MAQNLLKSIRKHIAKRKMKEFSSVPLEEAFDRIYERGLWSKQGEELSGGGSYGRIADDYVAFLSAFIKRHSINSILDVGCGDFNIGSRLAPLVKRYTALDVSARIIEINKKRYASLANVEFRQANACTEPLHKADLVTLRQVLQHLTNDQIEMILRNIERSRPRFSLVTEHHSGQTEHFNPNLDLPAHSSLTRVVLGSGVVLSAPPFNRHASLAGSIPLADSGVEHRKGGEMLNIYLLAPGPA
jgi:SAM-dependent methyltransferase